jgi:protein TonB
VPYSGDSGNRAFLAALLASIVLHAALLAAQWPSLADSLKAPVEALAPLVARLVAPAPPAPEPRAAEPKPERPKPKPQVKPQSRPAPVPPPNPQPRVEPTVPPLASAAPAPAPAPAPVPAAPPAPAVRAAPSAPPPAAAVPDTESLLAQYRAALLQAAGRYKRYPPMARDNGWEGEVVVRMAIGADGAIVSLDVTASSGYRVLDRQALDMFRRAGPRVPVPEALRGKSFTLDLRAVYNLKDQTSG